MEQLTGINQADDERFNYLRHHHPYDVFHRNSDDEQMASDYDTTMNQPHHDYDVKDATSTSRLLCISRHDPPGESSSDWFGLSADYDNSNNNNVGSVLEPRCPTPIYPYHSPLNESQPRGQRSGRIEPHIPNEKTQQSDSQNLHQHHMTSFNNHDFDDHLFNCDVTTTRNVRSSNALPPEEGFLLSPDFDLLPPSPSHGPHPHPSGLRVALKLTHTIIIGVDGFSIVSSGILNYSRCDPLLVRSLQAIFKWRIQEQQEWLAPALPEHCVINEYHVIVDGRLATIVDGGKSKAVVEEIDHDKKAYVISVCCVTNHGRSDPGHCVMTYTRSNEHPPIENLHDEHVDVDWARVAWKPHDSDVDHDVYILKVFGEQNFAPNYRLQAVVLAPLYKHTVTGLEPGATYDVVVESSDSEMHPPVTSNCLRFTTTTRPPPEPPEDLHLSIDPPNFVSFTWVTPHGGDRENLHNFVSGCKFYLNGCILSTADRPCCAWRMSICKFAKKVMKIIRSDSSYEHSSFGFFQDLTPAALTARAVSVNGELSDESLPFQMSKNDVSMLQKVLENCDASDSSAHSSDKESIENAASCGEKVHSSGERTTVTGLKDREVPVIEITHDPSGNEAKWTSQPLSEVQHPGTQQKHPGFESKHLQTLLNDRKASGIVTSSASQGRELRPEVKQRLSMSNPHIYRPESTPLPGSNLHPGSEPYPGSNTQPGSDAHPGSKRHPGNNLHPLQSEDDSSEPSDDASIVPSESRIFGPIRHRTWSPASSNPFVIGQNVLPHSKSRNRNNLVDDVARQPARVRTPRRDEKRRDFAEPMATLSSRAYHVAMYDYLPYTMSPNTESYDEELPFREGEVVKVYGGKDGDGFYFGENHRGQRGYIPSNMVAPVQVSDFESMEESFKRGDLFHPSLPQSPQGEKNVTSHQDEPNSSHEDNEASNEVEAIQFRAMYDYNPRQTSPNPDSDVELSFARGDVINVFGPADNDGFYKGELEGRFGLIPSNFVEQFDEFTPIMKPQPSPSNQDKVSATTMTEPAFFVPVRNNDVIRDHAQITDKKSKSGILSKGRKIFKRLSDNVKAKR